VTTTEYDGEGRRVKKVAGGVETYYFYDALGRLAAEYSTGEPAATGTTYLFADMLESVRRVDAIGSCAALGRGPSTCFPVVCLVAMPVPQRCSPCGLAFKTASRPVHRHGRHPCRGCYLAIIALHRSNTSVFS
jgi:hypothetical protein